MLLINDFDDCKNCMSINHLMLCDSVDTKYSLPCLNFPCRYYIDRDKFLKRYLWLF